jgi:pyruvate dehydrogenase E2 component (dihydrolipoamide acetyltransferase)
MESGTIVKWLKSEGEEVKKGEPLYELDTDKVTQEVEADFGGVLLKIAVQEGEVEVGRTIAFIGEAGEEVAAESKPAPSENGKEAAREVEERPEEEGSRAPARDDERERGREASAPAQAEPGVGGSEPQSRANGRVKASPLARRIARERGIDIARLSGTGPEGRIIAADVEGAAAAPSARPAEVRGEVEAVKLTTLQKTIAKRMTEAWQAPVFQITMSADMTAAQALRARLVERLREGDTKPTVSDLLTKAAAVALMRHRDVNVQFAGDELHRYPSANVGIAVATDRGLVVPVVHGSERKTIGELAAARADVVSRARDGKLRNEDFADGTFTISNLGMYGVEVFTAVINPPQAAILAVGAIQETAVIEGGDIVAKPLMHLTLTCDHRAVDGATAADFLRTVKTFLEEPGLML